MRLQLDDYHYARLEAGLNDEERQRAARFHFDRDRKRFIVARGALRIILAGYLDIDPRDVCFKLGIRGKPGLAPDIHRGDVRFNVTHSGEWALVAVTEHREVGVDLERVNPAKANRDVVKRFFAPGEISSLDQLTGDAWIEGFFRCWTRKEAFLKATGDGLYRPLDSFTVSVAPGEPARLLSILDSPGSESRWQVLGLGGPPDYAAALVVAGTVGSLHRWRWVP